MMKLNSYTWLAAGFVVLQACGSSKSDGMGPDNQSQPPGTGSTGAGSTSSGTNVGGKAGSGMTVPIGSAGTGSTVTTNANGGAASSTGTSATGSTGTGTGSNGTGSTGNPNLGGAGGSASSTDVGIGTEDPPPATGGSGQTEDPPPAVGGSGQTEDPPPGTTVDPPPGTTVDPPPGTTVDPPPGTTVDPPPGTTVDPPPGCTLTDIDKVNVIVFKDAAPNGADAEGRMWVGGNLTLNGGYSVNATDIAALKSTCNDWALVVGGDIVGDPIVPSGKAAYGGTFTGAFSSAQHCGIFHTKPVDFTALEAKFDGYSAAFKAYPANGTAAISGGYLVLTGTSNSLNVFNVTAEQLNNGVKYAVPPASSVIVNVSGGSITWQGKGFIMPDGTTQTCKATSGVEAFCGHVLYNMYEATSVYLSGIGVQGSILAPYATVDGGGGNIDGQLVCKNLTGGLEYHPYYFNGCLLLPKA